MMMKINPWQPMQRKDQTRERSVIILPEEIKSFKGTQDPKETTHPLNASDATIWNTLYHNFVIMFILPIFFRGLKLLLLLLLLLYYYF